MRADTDYRALRALQLQHVLDCARKDARVKEGSGKGWHTPNVRRSHFRSYDRGAQFDGRFDLIRGDRRAVYLIRGVDRRGQEHEYVLHLGVAALRLDGELGRAYRLKNVKTGEAIVGRADQLHLVRKTRDDWELEQGVLEESADDGRVNYLCVPEQTEWGLSYKPLAIEQIGMCTPTAGQALPLRRSRAPTLPRNTYSNAA